MFFLLLLAFVSQINNLNCQKINPNNLVLNINSSAEDIWLFYKGSIIKSKKTNILKPLEGCPDLKILVVPVSQLKLKIAEDNNFLATFSNYELDKKNYLLVSLETQVDDNKINWKIEKKEIDSNFKIEDSIIILADPNYCEFHDFTNNKVTSKSLILPTIFFRYNLEFKKTVQENNLAILDLRQFHSCKNKEKVLNQDALVIKIAS